MAADKGNFIAGVIERYADWNVWKESPIFSEGGFLWNVSFRRSQMTSAPRAPAILAALSARGRINFQGGSTSPGC